MQHISNKIANRAQSAWGDSEKTTDKIMIENNNKNSNKRNKFENRLYF